MNLDRLFEPPIVRECDVRITSAAMGIHDAILALQLLEQLVRIVCIDGLVRHIRHLCMGGANDRPPLIAIEHIPITSNGRIGRPLVTGNTDKCAGLIEPRRHLIELIPKITGDLKVIALMRADIEEGPIATEQEILFGSVRTECLIRLPMQIAPVVDTARVGCDTEWIGSRNLFSVGIEHTHEEIGRVRNCQTFDELRE